MRITPVAKLNIGENIVTVPEYKGIYRVARCGDRVGLFPQPPSTAEPVQVRILAMPENEVLTVAAKYHGTLEMPWFGWCGVFEVYDIPADIEI